MSDVTQLLDAAAAGDRQATADLLPLVYDELRNGPNDAVTITVDSTTHTTTVVANGKTLTFDHLFTVFDVEREGKKDVLTFDFMGPGNDRLGDLLVRSLCAEAP